MPKITDQTVTKVDLWELSPGTIVTLTTAGWSDRAKAAETYSIVILKMTEHTDQLTKSRCIQVTSNSSRWDGILVRPARELEVGGRIELGGRLSLGPIGYTNYCTPEIIKIEVE